MNLIELHILQSFPVTCLNRDDVGAPKTAYFGGCQRARVSSQCWKRAIRSHAKEAEAELFSGQRTRFVVRELRRLYGEKCLAKEVAVALTDFTADALGNLDDPEKGNVKTLLYFSPAELATIVEMMLESDYAQYIPVALQDPGDNKKAGKEKENAAKQLAGLAKKAVQGLKAKVKDAADIAIFGRMVADDHSLMLEGAGLFSHALSTHAVANEIDFFSAVDDNNLSDSGAGHIGTLEFNSACYYRYVGLNLDLLRDDNHLGHFDAGELRKVIDTFLRAALIAVPSARKNSMFGFNPPGYVLGLRRTGQPLSLVNAFESPVRSASGFLDGSLEALGQHWSDLVRTYCLRDGISTQVAIPETNLNAFIAALVREL